MKDSNNTKMDKSGGNTHPPRFSIHRSLRGVTIFGLSGVLVVLSCVTYFDTGLLLPPPKPKAVGDYNRSTTLENFEFSSLEGYPAPSAVYSPATVPLRSPENETARDNFTLGNEFLMPNSSFETSESVKGNNSGGIGIGETGQKKEKEKKQQLGQCDLSVGTWVWDESYPIYQSQNCPFIDGGFLCQENGRPDRDYLKWRWQPSDCDLPRFDAWKFLESIRNRRLVFVGDSIGRNHWESMVCMLAEAVPNKTRIYEVNGNPITKHKGFLSFRFEDYNCTVEYYRSPFLVYQGHPPRGSSPQVRMTLKLDVMDYTSNLWVNGDILVFNTGHWWNYEKTLKGGCYFEEGGTVHMDMDIETAFKRSFRTWVEWVRRRVNSEKTHVFLRSYAPVHFRYLLCCQCSKRK
uniref:TSA: Wollemia nobilis Ref_Wollemi_Transcript_2550_1433 transcribed RNA sequence n=1 Tax=Wollemia nobilis TaxID=56998 RepID=A0A0C9SAK8_9CONI